MGFSDSSVGKESACNARDPNSIPGSGRSAGEGIGYPLQYSWASLAAQLVKSCLQWGRPGFNPWFGKIPWRRERLPTPVFWPGEFHGLYRPWGHKESHTTEWLSLHYVHEYFLLVLSQWCLFLLFLHFVPSTQTQAFITIFLIYCNSLITVPLFPCLLPSVPPPLWWQNSSSTWSWL